jgi:hypothetical protein
VSLHEEKKALLAQIKSMREWVVEVEHIFDGSWASQAEEITNVEVARRFDAYLERLSCFVDAQERTDDEKFRLGHLLKVLTHLKSGLVQCYDIEGFPRTNNEMERTIRAIKMHYRRISGRKTGTRISCDMDGVSPIKNGGSSNLMARLNCKLVYVVWHLHRGDWSGRRHANATWSSSTAFVFATVHSTIWLL